MRDTTPLLIALGKLFLMLPPDKEPVALALVNTDVRKWTDSQKMYLWKVLQKYEFSLKMIGVKLPPQPATTPKLPDEPHFVDFINGKYVLRLAEHHAEHIGMVPKAKYDRKSGLYSVPQRMLPVLGLHKFVKEVGIYYTEAAKEAILWMYKEMRERYHASSAHDADIDMGEFGLALDPFQKAGIKAAARCVRAWICDEMGLGKTRQGLGVAHVLNSFPLLVICPASGPINWQREAQQAFPRKRVVRCEKKSMPKHTCQQSQLSLLDLDKWDDRCKACCIINADIVIVNYDKLPDGWKAAYEVVDGKKKKIKGYKREKGERAEVELSEVAAVLRARGFKAVFIDESHYIKEETSQRTKATHEVAQGSVVRLALSGTPIKNRPKELISQAKFLDRMDDLGGHDVFCREFCAAEMKGGKYDDTGSANEALLNKYLRSIGFIQRAKRDVRTELPPIRYAEIWVEIDNRPDYDRAEAELVQWCAEQAVLKEEFQKMIAGLNPAMQDYLTEKKMIETRIRIMKVQALIKMNVLKGVAAKGKITAAKEWIGDFLQSGKPIVIFAHGREVQYSIGDAFHFLHIYGKDNVTQRQKHRDIYMGELPNDSGLNDQGIVCSFGAAREGWNLDKGDDILLLETQWTPPDEDQAIARIDRHRVHNITAWRMFAHDTVEEKIKMRLEQKRRICDAVTKGERGPATASELDSVWDVVSDLAAMSPNKIDREGIARRAQMLLDDAANSGPGSLQEEAARLEATLEEAV